MEKNSWDFETCRNCVLLLKLFWPTVRKNCSSDQDKLLKFKAEGREFAKNWRSLEQFIQTVKGQNNFWQQNAFLTCSWRFVTSSELEHYISNWKKLLGFRNMQEKLENYDSSIYLVFTYQISIKTCNSRVFYFFPLLYNQVG